MNKVILDELSSIIKREVNLSREHYLAFYKDTIVSAKAFALGDFYWLIPNQKDLKIMAVASDIVNLCPYPLEEWEDKDIFFWFSLIHPLDRDFVSSAMAKFLNIQVELGKEKGESVFANIYLRMLNKENIYRWVLLQFPKWMYDENGTIISTLVLVTDLSYILRDFEKLFTVIDHRGGTQIFTSRAIDAATEPKFLIALTPRELEILQLMVQGLSTPQIAEKLSIAYNTVENHKSNMRRKTNSHNSAQLIDFLWKNSIFTFGGE